MANKYDPPGMKRGAEAIERELGTFSQLKERIITDMDSIAESDFQDETGRRLVQMYKRDAKPAMEELEKTLNDFVSLLKVCAQKFGSAIDNGNSFLSS